MSYGVSQALQTAVFQHLTGDAALAALVGSEIYDAPPNGPVPEIMVLIGPEDVRDRSDATAGGARHDFRISVIGGAEGFARVKAAAAAVSDALVDAPLTLARGRLVGLHFLRARALRPSGRGERRVDLTFRARIDDISS